MAGTVGVAEFKEVLLFLGTAGVVVPLFRRVRISPVIGFIAAGVALGPFGLGRLANEYPALGWVSFADVQQMMHISELGVVFLLFMIGLELSFERLSSMRRLVFGLGAAQVMLSTAALAGIAAWFGQPAGAALVIGGALALSSTAIVVPVMAESKRLNTSAGRTAFAILLFQDLAVAPLLFMIAILGAQGGGGVGEGLLYAVLPAAAALVVLLGAGRWLLRPLFRLVARAQSTEFFMAACLLVVLGTGLIAATSGLSMGLGAFIAGLLLAETEFRREIEVTIEPFKGLLLGLFFVAVGAALDFDLVMASPRVTLGLALLLIVVKIAILYGAARFGRVRHRTALEVSLLLGPGGEFAFVMIGAAMTAGIVAPHVGGNVMIAVTLSMLTIPLLAILARKLAPPPPPTDSAVTDIAPPASADARVIIVGFGRVGKLVADMMRRHDVPYLAIDSDVRTVQRERENGVSIYWGNATRAEFLRVCDIEHARALIVTMDAPRAVEHVVRLGRQERSDLTIVARARDAEHARVLYELGATDAIPETIEASLQLSEAALVDIGVPMGFVIASIHEKRDEYRKVLQPAGAEPRQRRAIKMSTRVKNMNKPKPVKAE
jgi:CPA2 family monovalent cation:H+ antiporter-2